MWRCFDWRQIRINSRTLCYSTSRLFSIVCHFFLKKPKKEKKLIILNFRKSVRLGEHTLSTDIDCNNDTGICNEKPQDFDIEEIIFHPEYGKPKVFRNDIDLLRLAKPYNQSTN